MGLMEHLAVEINDVKIYGSACIFGAKNDRKCTRWRNNLISLSIYCIRNNIFHIHVLHARIHEKIEQLGSSC